MTNKNSFLWVEFRRNFVYRVLHCLQFVYIWIGWQLYVLNAYSSQDRKTRFKNIRVDLNENIFLYFIFLLNNVQDDSFKYYWILQARVTNKNTFLKTYKKTESLFILLFSIKFLHFISQVLFRREKFSETCDYLGTKNGWAKFSNQF